MSTLFPIPQTLCALSALLLRLRLRDNVVRFRRRVSPTSLALPLRSPTRPLSSLSDISPALHFPYPALPASPCLLYCHVVLVLTLSRERVTLSTTSNSPPFPNPPFSSCRCHPRHPPAHFHRSPTAFPAGFIREAKCARDSYSLRKRARMRERKRK